MTASYDFSMFYVVCKDFVFLKLFVPYDVSNNTIELIYLLLVLLAHKFSTRPRIGILQPFAES